MKLTEQNLKILFKNKPEIERIFNDTNKRKIDKGYIFDSEKDEINAFIKLCKDDRMFETIFPNDPLGRYDYNIEDFIPEYDEIYKQEQEQQMSDCSITLKFSNSNSKIIKLYDLVIMIFLGRECDNNVINNQKDLENQLQVNDLRDKK